MKIYNKLAQIKTTIQEIKLISDNLGNENVYKNKIEELNKEIQRLEKGIAKSVDALEEFLKDKDA